MKVLAIFFRAFEQFKEAINDEDFEDLLKDAQADPKGVAAQGLLKKVLSFLNISGRQVPWGNVAPHFTPQHWLLCHMGLY